MPVGFHALEHMAGCTAVRMPAIAAEDLLGAGVAENASARRDSLGKRARSNANVAGLRMPPRKLAISLWCAEARDFGPCIGSIASAWRRGESDTRAGLGFVLKIEFVALTFSLG
jgi:hypothetical protein